MIYVMLILVPMYPWEVLEYFYPDLTHKILEIFGVFYILEYSVPVAAFEQNIEGSQYPNIDLSTNLGRYTRMG